MRVEFLFTISIIWGQQFFVYRENVLFDSNSNNKLWDYFWITKFLSMELLEMI